MRGNVRPCPDLSFENEAFRQGYRYVAGIDEAGRGCLAGPVVAAAVILPAGLIIEGVDDSKKLTPAKREKLYSIISQRAVTIGIGIVNNEEIDGINIYRATIKAMEMAVMNLEVPPDYLLPDYLLIDAVPLHDLRIPQQSIIKGDTLSSSIASASIVAKVTRDMLMTKQHHIFPLYNFMSHKGYGTKEHIERLKQHGPCAIHRRSFLGKIFGGGKA